MLSVLGLPGRAFVRSWALLVAAITESEKSQEAPNRRRLRTIATVNAVEFDANRFPFVLAHQPRQPAKHAPVRACMGTSKASRCTAPGVGFALVIAPTLREVQLRRSLDRLASEGRQRLTAEL